MKIRQGFVSNSSSSSFLIFGKEFDTDDCVKEFDLTQEQKDEYEENGCVYELLESMIPYKSELEYHFPEGDDSIYIGISWDKVKDDETGLDFKKRIKSLLNDKLGTSLGVKDLDTHSATWYG